jgi:hypothetical protein
MQSGTPTEPGSAPALREKQKQSHEPAQARLPTYGFSGRRFREGLAARESPALRGFHGPGRTRTCVLRIMS